MRIKSKILKSFVFEFNKRLFQQQFTFNSKRKINPFWQDCIFPLPCLFYSFVIFLCNWNCNCILFISCNIANSTETECSVIRYIRNHWNKLFIKCLKGNLYSNRTVSIGILFVHFVTLKSHLFGYEFNVNVFLKHK